MPVARFLVAYHGRGFHGFAENRDVRTVSGEFRAALERVVRQPVELTGAGRTDAGVHAWGQMISCPLPESVDLDEIAHRLNSQLTPEIAVRRAEWTTADFSARFSAEWRHYHYEVWNAAAPNPLLAATTWWVRQQLDVAAMQTAADTLVGEHDFASFCRRPKVADDQPEPTLVRRILLTRWTARPIDDRGPDTGQRLRFEIRANAFCHQMVRSIVGTLVDVGSGKIAADSMPSVLAARDRAAAGQVAPPHGLTLWEVAYPT